MEVQSYKLNMFRIHFYEININILVNMIKPRYNEPDPTPSIQ